MGTYKCRFNAMDKRVLELCDGLIKFRFKNL